MKKYTIDINDGKKHLQGNAGQALYSALIDGGIYLPSICGGKGFCGRCKIMTVGGNVEITDKDRSRLAEDQIQAGWRLACQIKICDDIAIRIPVELLEAKPFKGELEAITDLNADIKLLRIRLDEPKRIEFDPGQYIKLNVPKNVDPSMCSRAFSIASQPSDDNCIELIIRCTNGICTNWIFNTLKPGDPISFNGPYGEFCISDDDREMIWVAGGSGMSAFWSILRNLAEVGNRRKCTLFFGAVQHSDLYLLDELRQYDKNLDWFTFVPALSTPAEADNWAGQTGLITDVLDRNLSDISDTEAYLCGSPGMIAAAEKVLQGKGIPTKRTFFDKFDVGN